MFLIQQNKDNVVLQLYIILGLLSTKYIVLRIKKDTRDFSDFIDAELPQPTLLLETIDGYFISWAVKGKITTKAQKNFYKDLCLRLKKTLLKKGTLHRVENSSVWSLQYALKDGYQEKNDKIYEMKYLASCCLSLNQKEEKEKKIDDITAKEEVAVYAGTYSKSDDAAFDFIRFKAYDYKKINIINNIETKFEDLENYAKEIAKICYEVIGYTKGICSLESKAKNIARWTYENYNNGKRKRKTKSNKELQMTRREIAIKNAKNKYKKAHKKILTITTSMFANEYRKKNGEWNISKIAKAANVDRKTVYKHLKDFSSCNNPTSDSEFASQNHLLNTTETTRKSE